MNNLIIDIINILDISISKISDIKNRIILRDDLINNEKYEKIKSKIPELKKYLSSSSVTALQQNATSKQKYPLINLLRQILKIYDLKIISQRESNGYTKSGKKLYKIYYKIT